MSSLPVNRKWRAQSGLADNCMLPTDSIPVECRWQDTCPAINARTSLSGAEGSSFQLLDGWHQDDAGKSLWSMQNATMLLRNPGPRSSLSISGLLSPSVHRSYNTLRIECDGHRLGLVRNYSDGILRFTLRRMIPSSSRSLLHIRFAVEDPYHPAEATGSQDKRALGFALFSISADPVGVPGWVKIRIVEVLTRWKSALGEWLLNDLPGRMEICGRMLTESGFFFREPLRDFRSASAAGLSIIVTDIREESALDACLSSIKTAVMEIHEPIEVLVVSERPPQPAFSSFPPNISSRWIQAKRGQLHSRALRAGVKSAGYNWIYVVGSEFVLDRSTLQEVLKWRAPQVFAVGSAMASSGRGWLRVRTRKGLLEPEDRELDANAYARGTLCVRGDAALYNRGLLRRIWRRNDPYSSERWRNLEWSVRAWRMGFETIFCPASRLSECRTKPASNRGCRDIDALRFLVRNSFPGAADLQGLAGKILLDATKWRASLWNLRLLFSHYPARLREGAYPFKELPLGQITETYYINPYRSQSKPSLILASPYVLFPPSHGSAVGTSHILRALQRHYSVHLISDEATAYSSESLAYFSNFATVRLLSGRKEDPWNPNRRIARIESHSHSALQETLRLLVSMHRPRFVEIEHVELAKLIEVRKESPPLWILNLHDVFLSDKAPGANEEDRYELDLINRFDALICCSSEDASLLGRSDVTIVPNAVDPSGISYEPSPAVPRILFVGPSRSPQNLPGLRQFLDRVYSVLLGEFQDLELWIVGGRGALEWARDFAGLRQRGVRLFEYVDRVEPLLQQCALTINPIRGNRGSCRKVVESIAAGRVCVSTREGARGYLEYGFPSLVTCEVVQDFAAPLRKLLHDVAYRRSLEKLDEKHQHALSWEYSQQKILDLYSALELKMGNSRSCARAHPSA